MQFYQQNWMFQKSDVVSRNWVDLNSLFQTSASSPDSPAPPFVLSVIFRTLSVLNFSNLIVCTSSDFPGNYIFGSVLLKCYNAFLVRGKTSPFMSSVSSFIALWTISPFILRQNFFSRAPKLHSSFQCTWVILWFWFLQKAFLATNLALPLLF